MNFKIFEFADAAAVKDRKEGNRLLRLVDYSDENTFDTFDEAIEYIDDHKTTFLEKELTVLPVIVPSYGGHFGTNKKNKDK